MLMEPTNKGDAILCTLVSRIAQPSRVAMVDEMICSGAKVDVVGVDTAKRERESRPPDSLRSWPGLDRSPPK
eukprot:975202-Amphidinium_carterae.2